MCATPEAVATCTHSAPMASPADCPCPGPTSECGGCFYCGMRWAMVLERSGNVLVGSELHVSAHREHGGWLSKGPADEAALVEREAAKMVAAYGADAAVMARGFAGTGEQQGRFYRALVTALEAV